MAYLQNIEHVEAVANIHQQEMKEFRILCNKLINSIKVNLLKLNKFIETIDEKQNKFSTKGI